MDLRLLRYFIACVEHKTMHAAANAVNVSQPALSKAIRNLETDLGVTLLDRQPRGVVPTPFGETLFRYAKMVDNEMRRAVAEIDAMRGMTRGTIVVGVIPTMATVLASVARLVMEQHPGLKLQLRVAFSSELTSALLEGEIDLAVLLLPADSPQLGLEISPLIRTSPAVVARSGHPLEGKKNLSLRELAEFPWLIPDYPPTHRNIINRAFIDAGLTPPAPAIRVSTVIFFDSLIRETDLVTVVPATLLNTRESAQGLVRLHTDFPFPTESVGMAYRHNSTLLPGARRVMDLVRECCAPLPGYVSPAPAFNGSR
jgi:DNA-binding transcriptional LysR family regulator